MQVRNRIKKLAQLDPSQIVPNPKNWRTHPHAQREVLGGLFADIGIVNACIVRPVGDDKFMLIDGHLRTEVLADQKIPCIILDVNEQEADKILLSLDPLSGMAQLDPAKLNELLSSVELSNESLQSLKSNLQWQADNFISPSESESIIENPDNITPQAEKDYGSSSIKQIILVFGHAQFQVVCEALTDVCEKFGLSNNTEAVVHLLTQAGYNVNEKG